MDCQNNRVTSPRRFTLQFSVKGVGLGTVYLLFYPSSRWHFKCQMVYICANMNRFSLFFSGWGPQDNLPLQQCTLSTVFWYYGEIQEKTSSNKVATQKILTVNQNCTPFLFSLFFIFGILNFKVGGSDTPPLGNLFCAQIVIRQNSQSNKGHVLSVNFGDCI